MTEAFLPVAAPASVIPDRRNEYYKNDDDVLAAIGAAMRDEYRQIIHNGLLVQLDDARTAVTFDRMVPPGSLQDYLKWVARDVEILNEAIKGLPRAIRYHAAGELAGTSHHRYSAQDHRQPDPQAEGRAFAIEGANPRHEHEWKVWADIKLPEDVVLIPALRAATDIVEHPN